MNRGELLLANRHREQVELHAAHVGSAWQVEIWEATALTLVLTQMGDIIGLTRTKDRLAHASKHVSSLKRYHQLASIALTSTQDAKVADDEETLDFLAKSSDRSYIGWGAHLGYIARALNQLDRPLEAIAIYERARKQMTAADDEWVSMFLQLELEYAQSQAKLGNPEKALEHLSQLRRKFAASEHPLALGMIEEYTADIAIHANMKPWFTKGLTAMEKHFRPTENPLLIARCERMAELGAASGLISEGGGQRATSPLLQRTPAPVRRTDPGSAAQTARVTRRRARQ